MTSPNPAQLARIRATMTATVEGWLTDYGITPGKEHPQLVNRLVAAMVAMHKGRTITINQEGERPEGGV